MSERKPEEVMKALEDQAVEGETRVAEMRPEETARELHAAGYDLDAVHAEADALFEKLRQVPVALPGPSGELARLPVRPPALRSRTLLILAAGVSAAVSVAVSIPTSVLVVRAVAPAATAPVVPPGADEIRRKALEGCVAARWVECLHGLDVARRDDPAGDTDPRVQLARREAAAGIVVQSASPRDVDANPRLR